MSVDLTEQTLTAGGTADPARHIYRLLPEVLAARIEKLPPYEYCGTAGHLPAGGDRRRRRADVLAADPSHPE